MYILEYVSIVAEQGDKIGRIVFFGHFFIVEVVHNFGLVFHISLSFILIWIKNVLDNILGDFFTNSSVHSYWNVLIFKIYFLLVCFGSVSLHYSPPPYYFLFPPLPLSASVSLTLSFSLSHSLVLSLTLLFSLSLSCSLSHSLVLSLTLSFSLTLSRSLSHSLLFSLSLSLVLSLTLFHPWSVQHVLSHGASVWCTFVLPTYVHACHMIFVKILNLTLPNSHSRFKIYNINLSLNIKFNTKAL
jgi:hypothetical protein